MPLTRQMAPAPALARLCSVIEHSTSRQQGILAILAILGPGQMPCHHAAVMSLPIIYLSTYYQPASYTSLLSRYFITSSPGMQPRPVQSGEERSIVDILLAQNKRNKRRHMVDIWMIKSLHGLCQLAILGKMSFSFISDWKALH